MFLRTRHNRSAGARSGPPQLESGDAAVGRQQHSRLEPAQQAGNQLLFMNRQRAGCRGEHRVCPALHQCSDPHLRVGTALLSPAGTGTAEVRAVRLGVRDVEDGAVHGDQPPPAIPGAGRVLDGHRSANPREQCLQRLRPQPSAGSADRTRRRHVPWLLPLPHPFQALRQQPGDFLIALPGEQAHREHEIHHHPGRQQPGTLFPAPALRDHLIHHPGWKHPRQHPQSDPVRQPLTRRLHLPRPWHNTSNDQPSSKSPVLALGPVLSRDQGVRCLFR